MDYFGKDTAWYGGWCRGRRSINCPVRLEGGFCDCVIAELPQGCMKGCGRKIHEGDCITKDGDGWGHVECNECDNSSHSHRQGRRGRRQQEEVKEELLPRLNQDNSLDAILAAISNYRSPSHKSARTANSRRQQVLDVPNRNEDGELEGRTGGKPRFRTAKAEIIDRTGVKSKRQPPPSSEVTSSVSSLPIVTPRSDEKRPREDDTNKPSKASRRLQFQG